MLTNHDTATVRHAILKRLDNERRAKICDIRFAQIPDGVAVGIETLLDGVIDLWSRFDLPKSFELSHVHNEIDEIAEQYKAARKQYYENGGAFLVQPERQIAGTGLRGRWMQYG